jgi:6-phosphofructokinase 1
MKKVGIITAGGDCPGLNAVIRSVSKSLLRKGYKVIGFKDGFKGFIENDFMEIDDKVVSGIIAKGGTILGTNNVANPFKYTLPPYGSPEEPKDLSDMVKEIFKYHELECLITIGGDGTQNMAFKIFEMGFGVIGVPKTIDNDLAVTDYTFGYDTALSVATEAVDRVHTTAESHDRVLIVETMGRYAGWIALRAAIAGGGDLVLIPEIEYKEEDVVEYIKKRKVRGKNFSIVVVAEGAKRVGGDFVVMRVDEKSTDPIRLGGVSYKIAELIEKSTGFETRVVVLGHLQRGGIPTSFDRWLSTCFGAKAASMVEEKKFGKMVAIKGQEFIEVDLKDAIGQLKRVDKNSFEVKSAISIGMSFGNKEIE